LLFFGFCSSAGMFKFSLALLAVCACVSALKFTPHPIPCQIIIEFEEDRYVDDGEGNMKRIMVDHELHKHNEYFANSRYYKYPVEYYKEEIIRSDINKTDGGKKYVACYSGDTSIPGPYNAMKEWISMEDIADRLKSYMYMFEKEREYSSKDKGFFKGRKLNRYLTTEGGNSVEMYADDENYIIGYIEYNATYNSTCQMSYFDEAPLDDFQLQDRFHIYQEEPSDKVAYDPPTWETCQVASAGKPVAVFALVLVMSVLLSLF